MPNPDQTQPQSVQEVFKNVAESWKAISEHAPEIAKAKRTLFLEYVGQGFTEFQALELCKTLI